VDNKIVGKTPLCLKNMAKGKYDVSFIAPAIRDSILNRPLGSKSPRTKEYEIPTIMNGNPVVIYADADLARESNKRLSIDSCRNTTLTFNIQGAQNQPFQWRRVRFTFAMIGICSLFTWLGISLFVRGFNINL
jgi:hypothetical protein